jgi:predicted aspartyl protease
VAITFLKVKVWNPAKPRKTKTFRFLVDSGAVDSVLPASDLKTMGLKATSTREFMLANGESIRLRVGNAHFEYKRIVGAAPVVFGEEGVYLLGATTIEALGMILDPIRRELKPLPMLLM